MMTLHKAALISKIAHRLYGYTESLLDSTESLLGTSRFEIAVNGTGRYFHVIRNVRYLSYRKL